MKIEKCRIGIMGGTFDPIHLGHLVIAEAVRDRFQLERVLFVPAASPPHKENAGLTAASHRYLMTVLAVQSHPSFFASDIEMNRSGPSYTIDTVREMVRIYGAAADLYFITGADAIIELPTWREPERLLELCQFVAATRPGCNGLEEVIARYGDIGAGRIHRLETPELAISATDIRERVKQGKSVRYIVPDAVEHYIQKEGLYR